jgi:outer membrane receptor protein involved in Fe transport
VSNTNSLIAGILLALCFVGPAVAAQSLSTVQGFVTDDSGAAVPGVTVELVDLERGQSRTAATNSRGFFALRALPSGEYDLVASLSGFQTTRQEHIHVHVGQILEVDVQLGLASVAETVVVTAEAPLLEVGRGGAAGYVDEEEISSLPISGRDYVQFALLKPTVKVEPQRGGISLSGQRGINSGLTIDGADAKSAFFGYGRGGEATENGGLVVAQESVKEFQVVTSGYSAEAGRSGGGYINVVTKAGTNDFAGSGFFFFRDQRMVARLSQSPLDAHRGIDAADDRYEVDEFERFNWGASFGGPIVRDRTHFFLSYDQTARSQPFIRDIRGEGQYDAVLARYPDLVNGFSPNGDGTASGQFVRETDNLILFGKLNHRVNDDHSLTLRYNVTDYARTSDYVAEESRKLERTHALVGSLVSLLGDTGVNEFRLQYAYDDLDRLANLPDSALQANFRIFQPSYGSFGKPWWLPIYVDEAKFEIQERFSFLAGNHEIRLGFDFSRDDLSEYFAGNADGRYDFDGVTEFVNGDAARARIFFGDVSNPNFDITQQTLGFYLQDTWSPSARLTLNAGARWDGTFNPRRIEHVLPEGTSIPNDLDNVSPRAGFVYSLDADSIVRGGAGIFYGRTPTLLFFSAYSDTGVFPRYGNAVVAPGETGFVPLGGAIDNSNPPAGLTPSLSYVHPDFEDPRTTCFNLGYEREMARDLAASLDFVYARGDLLASNVDGNAPAPGRDEFGRPVYSGERINPGYGTVLVRQSLARSDYVAVTAALRRRFRDGIQFQAHYTWSRDRSNDDNERSSGSLTLTDPADPDYDWGISSRDIPHRFVASGVFTLPFDILASGILTAQSGSPYTALDPRVGFHNHPDFYVGPYGPQTRAVVGGALVPVNGERNGAWTNLDLRITKRFAVAGAQLEALFEVFNVFNAATFRVSGSDQQEPHLEGGGSNPEFGLGAARVGAQGQAQLGLRVVF